jgi:predicted nucleic acid-binding protein
VTLVVDASVALKWFLPAEFLGANALAVVKSGSALIAPDILIAEVCNGVWRSARLGRIAQAQLPEVAAILPRFFDSLIDAASLAQRAVAIAVELDHPVYDCLYVALTEARQAMLVSADKRLIEKLRRTRWEASAMYLAAYAPAP